MKKLNEKHLQVYEFLKRYVKQNKYPPTHRDICDELRISSTSSVNAYLLRLEEYGYITRDPQKPRAMILLKDIPSVIDDDFVNIPIIGKVAAGSPILAVENIEGYLALPTSISRYSDVYILIVSGDSMIDAGIMENDKLLARKQSWANNGEIVVAMMDGEATVKRYFAEKDHIRLQPENKNYKPILSADVEILGKVVGLIRNY